MPMTKDVIIGISGLQFTGEENSDSLEMIAPGEYYYKNGKHYIKYEEVIEGFSETNHNLVKIDQTRLELTKKGLTNLHMIFEENKKNLSCYQTPFGSLMIGIEGGPVTIRETADQIRVYAKYSLAINYEHVADCVIQMNIQSKDAGDFSFKDL